MRTRAKRGGPLLILGVLACAGSGGIWGCGDSAGQAEADGGFEGGDGAALEGGTADGASNDATPPAADAILARYLTGTFDSAEQAAADPRYYEIHLSICPVEAPELGPRVLYVEQARAGALTSPYRQRLYVIEAGESPTTQAVSRVFELQDPGSFVNLCSRSEVRRVQASEAVEREGCSVFLDWDGVRFEGGTEGKSCQSSLNGATHATSTVTLDAAEMRSWDRGFDANDQQVWGAVDGPYVFVRRTPLGE